MVCSITDPTIVRIIFFMAIFFGGPGVIAYIIMAIVVPKEDSKATEPKDTIKDNVKEIKDTSEANGKDIQKTF